MNTPSPNPGASASQARRVRRRRAGLPVLIFALAFAGAAPRAEVVRTNAPVTPREFYNEGTARLKEGKWNEAETALQTAVAANLDAVQAPALYNLGHARFRQGVEALKKAPDAAATQGQGQRALDRAEDAIQSARSALATELEQNLVSAYLRGRGARREMKAALAAVKKAVETHGAVLLRWQRAAGDFRSAAELQPKDEDARFNAEVVDRNLAGLVDQLQIMQAMMQSMGQKNQELRKLMMELKSKMPDGKKPGDEEGEEEEDEDKPPKKPERGEEEKAAQQGREMMMTWEEAMRLLQALKLDSSRKLPLGLQQTDKPQNRKGREW
jgi:hypothetical protein